MSEVEPGTQVTIFRITEMAEEDRELLEYLEAQDLVPGVHATVVDVSTGRDSLTIDGPRGRGSLGLRPASLIRVLPGVASQPLPPGPRPSASLRFMNQRLVTTKEPRVTTAASAPRTASDRVDPLRVDDIVRIADGARVELLPDARR